MLGAGKPERVVEGLLVGIVFEDAVVHREAPLAEWGNVGGF